MKPIVIMCLFGAFVFGAMQAQAIPLVDSSQMNLSAIDAIEATRGISVGTIIVWPAGANPEDADKWLECDGRSTAGYPELAAVIGANTPDYRDQFLRGGGTAQVGQVAADTTRSHTDSIPAHAHTVSGSASEQKVAVGSQNVTGSASGTYIDNHLETVVGSGYRNDGGHTFVEAASVNGTGIGGDPAHGHLINAYIRYRTLYGHNTQNTVTSNVTATTSGGTYTTGGGTITGWTNSVGNTSDATGDAETAPQHTRVRYLIRALP